LEGAVPVRIAISKVQVVKIVRINTEKILKITILLMKMDREVRPDVITETLKSPNFPKLH